MKPLPSTALIKPPAPKVTMRPLPSAPKPPTPKPLPLFTLTVLNTWLLALWNVPPHSRYMKHIILSVLRDAPLYIWTLPAGLKLRDSIRTHRVIFLQSLYEAYNSSDTAAAAAFFSRQIENWITELRLYAKRFPGINCTQGKAAELMVTVKHRSRNLTYRTALKNFGTDPKMETLVALSLRGALKELYALKNIV